MSLPPYDSSQSTYRFVRVDEFTPNSGTPWTPFGPVTNVTQDTASSFVLTGSSPVAGISAPMVKIYILGPAAFRVRFNPTFTTAADYNQDGSYAVVNKNLGPVNFQVLQNDATKLSLSLSANVRLDILLKPFTVQVYFKGNLVSTDTATQGLLYLPGVPGAQAVANFKNLPTNAHYFGFGEKGGTMLDMKWQSMTFFNYDNYEYGGASNGPNPVVPSFSNPGPDNTAEPLYNSIPLLIEDNPHPLDASGQPTGVPYAYGLFLDNESQSYFNIGQDSSYAGSMAGKYYFGALYGEIDYYVMVGNTTPEVLNQYTNLTGRAALVPMWVLGYHQGAYGYYDSQLVLQAVQQYRNASIPLDGIHIDVDFQNNYRTFTMSPTKFPTIGGQTIFNQLAALGVKASTNITGIVSMVPPDETGAEASYSVLNDGLTGGFFYMNVRVNNPAPPPNPQPLVVNESYGCNHFGFNPYPAPGAPFDPNCTQLPGELGPPVALGTYGHYADLGRLNVRTWWGQQYKPLLDAGLEMVWQDMTDPATQQSADDTMPWKTLPLNLSVYDFTSSGPVPHAQVHNVFALNLISATYEGIVALRQQSGVDKRPFIIARGGYAGVQRYAASWTGDSQSDWDFLSILIPEILNFGLSGQPLAGADVGGFASTAGEGDRAGGVAPYDLLTRWTQASAFIGWFRNHYDRYNKLFQEPYAYGEPALSNCKKYIEIRYKLLQYFYDALYECTQTGLPICRPLFVTDRNDPLVYQNQEDQFMVGHDILVAPVVTQAQNDAQSRNVYLPAGSGWFAYTDNTTPLVGPSPGGQLINWYVPLSLVPIYIRAGAIIPHRELEQYVGQLALNPLTFDIYPGPACTHMLYLDDKVSTQAQANNHYRLTELSQSSRTDAQRVQTLNVDRVFDQYTPAEPYYFVAMLQTPPPLNVSVNGAAVNVLNGGSDQASASALAASAVDAAYYNQSLQTTFIKVFDTNPHAQIVGTFPT